MRREAVFRNDLCNAVKAAWGNRAYVQKNFDPAIKGQPDCEFIIAGKQSYVELKAVDSLPGRGTAFDWGKEPSPIQLDTILRIQRAGGNGRCAVLIQPLGKVYVRSAEWIYGVRGGLMPGVAGRWSVEGMVTVEGFEWQCSRTPGRVLEAMLVGACL